MSRGADQPAAKPSARGLGAASARQMDPARASRPRRVDIFMNRDGGIPAAAERHQLAQQYAALRGRQILLAQAKPPTSAGKNFLGEFFEGLARLPTVRDDQQRRRR